MGQRRGPKFSFHIPGRKSRSKVDKSCDDLTKISSFPSVSSVPSMSERSLRYDESSGISSKAQRLLGTAPPPFRAMPEQSAVPASPGYTSIALSDAGSDYDNKCSSVAAERGGFKLPRRPALSNRASSNIIPQNVAYNGEEIGGSNCSSPSRHLHPATSSSTLHSHYDAKSSPLPISQQTSDSAVRDMALRKGKPQISFHKPSPLVHEVAEDDRDEQQRSRPPRLDLSKLFPKPIAHGGQEFDGTLLSPNKLVDSPTAMSTLSDFFPRPMTREPTPKPKGHAKLTKRQRQQAPSSQPVRQTSPARLHKRDTYDNAKINVRRPPQGIQHWFEGLSEDSDEFDAEENTHMHVPAAVNTSRHHSAVRKTSHGSLQQESAIPKHQAPRSSRYVADPRKPHHFEAKSSTAHRMNSPSSYSLRTQSSLGTARTKESAFSKSNLQDSSVLSFSSSEDERDNNQSSRRKASVRDSIDTTEDSGDFIIGQAQAYEVRPQLHSRRPSAGKLSLMSTSTNAATIEVVYTPEPPYTPAPSSKRTSHSKQPSIIYEVEDGRPKTSRLRSQSPSATSSRTSKSEPRSHEDVRKFIAVTPEEEALLEALRKKRAAMAQQSSPKGYESAIKHEESHHRTPPERTNKKNHRTSELVSAGGPSGSPVRIVETKRKASQRSLAPKPPPLLAPSRGRTAATQDSLVGSSILRDSSSCDPEREPPLSTHSFSRPLLSPPEFSPLDLFPSPTGTASVASPTTTDLPSSLPSPVTPRMRHGEDDVDVKVATSEPSLHGDTEEVAVLETGVIDAPTGSIKPEGTQSTHQRRRTASSGADAPFALPTKHQPTEPRNLTPVTETSSRATTTVEKPPKKSALRNASLSITTTGLPQSRHNSIVSARTCSPNRSVHERRSSRQVSRAGSLASMNSMASIKRDSVAVGTANTRCSVSEDVLAAWGSLGGLRDYDTARW